MKLLIDVLLQSWFLWIVLIGIGILEAFMPKIKGAIGEQSIAFFLSRLDKSKYKVLNNIMLKIGDRTTQIDHLVISNYGIFVIETKNYKGLIIGSEFEDEWRQVIYKRKEKLHNPIKQNYGHIQALKEILNEFTNINYISIIAFTTRAELKVKSKVDVVYTVNLLKTISKYNEECIEDSDKEKIYSKLLSLNIDNKENRKAHVEAIHKKLSEINAKIDKDICPRCGGKLVLKKGKYGEFKGCNNYPKCKFTKKVENHTSL